jgi:uncharacterized OB-fold protein
MSDARAKQQRPLPVPTETTKFFWDAAKQGKLALQYDPVAGQYQFWPRAISVATGRQNLEWRIVSGLGRLYSFTVTHVPTAGFEDRGPYPVGLVELDEGVRIIANLVRVDPAALAIGLRVKVAFEDIAPGVPYFAFEPAA